MPFAQPNPTAALDDNLDRRIGKETASPDYHATLSRQQKTSSTGMIITGYDNTPTVVSIRNGLKTGRYLLVRVTASPLSS
jgi:hypothetical protein